MKHIPYSRIAVFKGTGIPLSLERIPVPPLKPGEILVRNEFTSLCKSDLLTYSGAREEKTPTILGHEIVGRIAAFGPGTKREDLDGQQIAEGDRITWAIFSSEPESELARSGIPQKASGLLKYGHERVTPQNTLHGGLSECIILRPFTPLLKLSEELPVELASLINCSVSTVAGALRLAGDLKGKQVLISGAGMLGLVACAMSRQSGAAGVTVTDIDSQRIDRAQFFGADRGILWREEDRDLVFFGEEEPIPIDVILEYSGVASAMERSLECLGIGGTAIWVGATYPERDLRINAERMVRNIWTLKGLHNYNVEDFRNGAAFMETHHGVYPFRQLVEQQFAFGDAEEAFRYSLEKNSYRTGIYFDN